MWRTMTHNLKCWLLRNAALSFLSQPWYLLPSQMKSPIKA